MVFRKSNKFPQLTKHMRFGDVITDIQFITWSGGTYEYHFMGTSYMIFWVKHFMETDIDFLKSTYELYYMNDKNFYKNEI